MYISLVFPNILLFTLNYITLHFTNIFLHSNIAFKDFCNIIEHLAEFEEHIFQMVLATNWRAAHGFISLCCITYAYTSLGFIFVFNQIIGLPLAFQGPVTGTHHFSSWRQVETIMVEFLPCQEKLTGAVWKRDTFFVLGNQADI